VTPFYATLLVPLTHMDRGALTAAGFQAGPAFAHAKPSTVIDRRRSYRESTDLERLLSPQHRCHRQLKVEVGQLRLVAVEFLTVEVQYSPRSVWMILHAESRAESKEISALTQLGGVARPGRREFREFFEAMRLSYDIPTTAVSIDSSVARVPTLALSEPRDRTDHGLIRWPDADPILGRLVDLVVLRRDKADTPVPPDVEVQRPTPSYAACLSGESLSVVRLRALKDKHSLRLRTFWLDAFMLELRQAYEAQGLAAAIRSRSHDGKGQSWAKLDQDVGRWQTSSAWRVEVDHPMEAAIARLLRSELRTDQLVQRVREDLAQHAQRLRTKQSDTLNLSIAALTVASLISPPLLYLASGDDFNSWFLLAGVLNVLALAFLIGFLVHSRRPGAG
jgi:hypothetical protein